MCPKSLSLVPLLLWAFAGLAGSEALNRTAPPAARPPQAPAVLTDTTTDSPGTNLETRVVTFSAVLTGAPRLRLQWQVDKGHGFVPVSNHATNSVLVLPNAQVSDTGRYALFATNALGFTNSTPLSLVVVEAED